MSALTCLADLVPLHLDETPRREQRAYLGGGADPCVLQVVLERTAVVRRLPDIGERELVRLDSVYVDSDALVWVRYDPASWQLGQQSLPGGPTERERRARGRNTARANKLGRSVLCRECGSPRSVDEMSRVTGSLCRGCKRTRERERRAVAKVAS